MFKKAVVSIGQRFDDNVFDNDNFSEMLRVADDIVSLHDASTTLWVLGTSIGFDLALLSRLSREQKGEVKILAPYAQFDVHYRPAHKDIIRPWRNHIKPVASTFQPGLYFDRDREASKTAAKLSRAITAVTISPMEEKSVKEHVAVLMRLRADVTIESHYHRYLQYCEEKRGVN